MIEQLFRVKCDGCGLHDMAALAWPPATSRLEARERAHAAPDFAGRRWSMTPAGEDLCPRCTARRKCGDIGHPWGPPAVIPEGLDMRPWRGCQRCGAVQDVETGEVTL